MSNKLMALKDLDDLLCKYEVKDLEDLENRFKNVADLEAKIAESEHRNEQLVDALNGEVFINYKLPMENAQLKQQLAEKDADLHQIYSHLGVEAFGEDIHEQALKEIRRLLEEIAKKDKQLRTKIGNMKSTDFIMMCLECGFWIDAKEKDNQDKISFAVEQLEKVKEEFDCIYSNDTYTPYQIADKIDNQIKQLGR